MRKQVLILSIVLTTLAMASVAQAAVPDRFNGTRWRYTAIQFGATNATQSVMVAPEMIANTATNKDGLYNATGAHVFNATRGAYGTAGTNYNTVFTNGNASFLDDETFLGEANGTDGLLAYRWSTVTNASKNSNLYFLYNPDQSLFVSLGNETFRGGAEATDALPGAHMGFLVQNLTIANNVSDVSGTWYFYGLVPGGNPVKGNYVKGLLGSMSLASAGTGTASFYYTSTNGTNGTGTDTLTWQRSGNTADTGIDQYLELSGTYINVSYGFLSSDKKIMTGVYATNDTADNTYHQQTAFIALKSGGTFSSSNFVNAGFKYFSLERGNATQSNQGNATAAYFYTDENGKVLVGNRTTTVGKSFAYDGAMKGAQLTAGSVTLNGVAHSTAAMQGRTFIGRSVADVTAGIVVDNSGLVGLRVMVPASTMTSTPAAATTSETTTFNDASTFTIQSTTGATGLKVATLTWDVADPSFVDGTLGTLTSQFNNATSDALKTQFGLGSGATIDRSFPTVTFGSTMAAGDAGNMTVRKITFAGNNKLIRELAIPTKFYVNATSSNAANSTRQFTYRNAGQAITDGSWWITPAGAPTVTLDYSFPTRMTLGQNYDLWLAIQDNGKFDLSPSPAAVVDPSGFVSGLGGGGGGLGGGGDDAGCVLNPAATLSLDLLLLLLAPAAYFIRRRKK